MIRCAFPVHAASGIWGTIALGLFSTEGGLFTGGGWHLLGEQSLGLAVLCIWGLFSDMVRVQNYQYMGPYKSH